MAGLNRLADALASGALASGGLASGRLPGAAVFGGGLLIGVAAVTAAGLPRRRRRRRRPTGGRPGELPASAPVPQAEADTARLPDGPARAADLVTSIAGHDVTGTGDLIAQIESIGVAVADGPPPLVDRMLRSVAAQLAARNPAGSRHLILVSFPDLAPDLAPGTGQVTCCADLAAALDLVVANAVTLRRRLDKDAPMPVGRASGGEPRPTGWRLTVLVGRIPPTATELTLLTDLVAEPGSVTALLPAGGAGRLPGLHRVLMVGEDPDNPQAIVVSERSVSPAPPAPAAPTPPVPRRPEPPGPQVAERSGHRSPQAGSVPSLRVGVLGALTINGQAGGLVPAQTQLIVALALGGSAGRSNRQLCELLGADSDHPRPTDSLRQLIVRTRRQLGRAGDGREWIEHLGYGQYALHPDARVDLVEFEALATDGMAAKDAPRLAQALGLVRGQPFDGCYYWWLDFAMVEAVRARIVTAAEALAEIGLASSDPAAAARAARIGLGADASAEELWRVLMRAEHAAGNLVGVREAWSRCLDALAEIAADGQPDSATAAVYEELLAR